MNTDPNTQDESASVPQQATDNANQDTSSSSPNIIQETGEPVIDLVTRMQSVDTNSPEAQLNATSMPDNNGGRIEFNEDYDTPDEAEDISEEIHQG